MSFEISIAKRSAWAPGMNGAGDWADWAAGRREIERSDASPELPFLPSLFKRRLGRLDKMALFVGHEALCALVPTRTLFATRYGEIGQQYRISSRLVEEGEVSPSAFSLSVFNAPASLVSIAERNSGSASAIHAGAATFAAGICCCLGMLARESSSVLLIAADESLPEAYAELESGNREGDRGMSFALALLLVPGRIGRETFSVECAAGGDSFDPEFPEALVFLRWLIAGADKLCLGGREWPISFSRSGI